MFYCKEITSSNGNDKVLDTQCVLCQVLDSDTYLTFLSNDGDVLDYNDYVPSYYDIGDSLSAAEFNNFIALLRHNTIHEDTIDLVEDGSGKYGLYLFNVDGCTILDTEF